MDTEHTDAIDIGVNEQLSETFNGCVSLTDTVPVAMQESEPNIADCQKLESKKGDCYIFNYQAFEKLAKDLSPRKGSEKDAARLKYDFLKLNLDVHLYENLSHEETYNVLKEASMKDYSLSKYFVCCFLTHGGQNGVLWAKDDRMYIADILPVFSKLPSLKGIPKIFIIEACRGKEPELPISIDSTDSGFSNDTEDYPDLLVVNSTYIDTVSFRTTNKQCHGAFFIDELCCSLEEFSGTLDLLQILTIVNHRMANMFLSHFKDNKELDEKKQMPCFYTTLRSKVEFNQTITPFVSKDTQYFDKRRKRHGSGHHGSAKDPQSNSYIIKEAERVLFLSVVDKNIDKKDSLLCAVHLEKDFASRNYSHKAFQDSFKRSKILKFLNQNSNPSGQRDESEVDCLIVYIAAYTRNDSVCDAGGRKISKSEIVEEFIGQSNKSFVGKPKIFIFLLCKLMDHENLPDEKFTEYFEPTIMSNMISENSGRRLFRTDSVDGDSYQSVGSTDTEVNTDTEPIGGGHVGENLIPIHADILEICITITDWAQAIAPIKLFQEILKKNSTKDFLSLLTEINNELIEKHKFFETSTSFSMISTLTKTLFLP